MERTYRFGTLSVDTVEWGNRKSWHWEAEPQPTLPERCLGQHVNNPQEDFQANTVIKSINPQHNVAKFISLLYPHSKLNQILTLLCFPYSFPILLNSLKNTLSQFPCLPFKINLGKNVIAFPSTPAVTLLWARERRQSFSLEGHTTWPISEMLHQQSTSKL